jgi:ABC-type transport system involved in multi-copper enzyme maturation permease subunit
MSDSSTAGNPALLSGTAQPLPFGGYFNFVEASFGLALLTMLRRQRLILAAVITLLPVLIPLAMAFLSTSQFEDDGNMVFVKMTEQLQINVLAPLLALFFACMLVGEDMEANTISYMLTRPLPRSAWVLGRFLAYVLVSGGILLTSICLTFSAATSLAKIGFNRSDLLLLAHYCAVALGGLICYGAFAAFLGATTRRPIVIGVILLYAWQRLAMLIPGLVDFFTIQKYTDALLPRLATQRHNVQIQTVLGTFQKDVFMVSATKAGITMCVITAFFLAGTILAVRWREYASTRVVGG